MTNATLSTIYPKHEIAQLSQYVIAKRINCVSQLHTRDERVDMERDKNAPFHNRFPLIYFTSCVLEVREQFVGEIMLYRRRSGQMTQ